MFAYARAENLLKTVSWGASSLVLLIASLAILGWTIDSPLLRNGGGLSAMNPATAAGMILAALSLMTLACWAPHRLDSAFGICAAAAILILGLQRLSEFFIGWHLPIDDLLFASSERGNQMASNTASCFALFGAALLLVRMRHPVAVRVAQVCCIGVGILGLMTVVGYAYGAADLYRFSPRYPMAINTGVSFLLLVTAFICALPKHGVMAALMSPHAGGVLARRLLPVALCVPLLLGFLRILGERYDLLGDMTGEALVAVLSSLCLLAFIGRATAIVDRANLAQDQVQNELELERDRLESRVRQQTVAIRLAHEETIHRLVSATNWRDEETGAHIRRTGLFSEILARQAGWSSSRAEQIRLAAPMHDVGKIGIPDAILRKPGKLTPSETAIMRQHTLIGAQMLDGSPLPILQMACEIARCHHERWNGAGYPFRLRGQAIPECARIVSIVDVYDALTHDRIYRPALPYDEVLSIMQGGAGSQFDPYLLAKFFEVLDEIEACAALNPDERTSTSASLPMGVIEETYMQQARARSLPPGGAAKQDPAFGSTFRP